MYVIIGIKNEIYPEEIGETYKDHRSDEKVATFDTHKQAKEYIAKSKLKQPQRRTYASDIMFKKKSLLRNYEQAYIDIYVDEELPHNPKI